jgi:hypothetical protein
LAVELYRRKKPPIPEICKTLGITRPTLYAYAREAEEKGQEKRAKRRSSEGPDGVEAGSRSLEP